MSKRITIATFIILFIFSSTASAATTNFIIDRTEYIVDGQPKTMDVSPYIKNNRTYLPVRYVAESLGASVFWDDATQTVSLIKGDNVVNLKIGSNTMTVKNEAVHIDVAAEITNQRTMLPFRFIAEAFGANVSWNDYTRTITLEEKPYIGFISAGQRENSFPITYTWKYGSYEYKWALHASIDVLNYYRKRERPRFTPQYTSINNQVVTYASDPDDDIIISTVVNELKVSAERDGIKGSEVVDFVVSFVQGLPYVSDSDSTSYDEYTKYPVETLLERGGDCEDTAILTAVLLRGMGYGSSLIFLPGHAATGVLTGDNPIGSYYTVDEKNYLYLETTNSGWKIGEIPTKYINKNAYVIPLP